MNLIDNSLLKQIQYLGSNKSNTHFKEYLQTILEDTSKPYYKRADYIGLSLNEIKTKIDYLSSDIKELTALKKKLSTSLDLAKQEVATLFVNNGIDKIDGTIISSLTLTNESSKENTDITIKDENALMALGYVKFSLDTEAIENIVSNNKQKELQEILEFIDIKNTSIKTPAKIKVNTKRVSNTDTFTNELKQAS